MGARGLEPPTFCSQSRRATGLRYAPGAVITITQRGGDVKPKPEFVVTQEKVPAPLPSGRAGYGLGPGDLDLAPNVGADIQTAYRARAGEAGLSRLER